MNFWNILLYYWNTGTDKSDTSIYHNDPTIGIQYILYSGGFKINKLIWGYV